MSRLLPLRSAGAAALALVLSATPTTSAWAARPKSRAPKQQPAPPQQQPRAEEPQPVLRTYLNAALRLYESLEYERALEQIRRAKSYTRSVDDDVTVSLFEGVILADMGRKEDAIAAFRTGLLLRPEATLPVKVSPKVERDFETVRQGVRRELATLQAKQQAEQKPPEPGGETPAQQEPTSTRSALDAPAAATPDAAVATATPAAPRSKTLSYALMGGGVVATGVGAYLGVSALSYNQRKLELRADDAVKARSQAETQLTAGAVLVPVGLAALGTGLVMMLLPGDTASTPSSTVSLAPLPGGVSLGAAGRF
ncbi:hypothetical protein JRI60_27900 [Archangium violaceum]|uniref:hypothetical protein n=1 Tax=Archangium violaceum TaxID=83451 RepID=UPI00194E3E7E|nr:hypothetical protein [Archangium violaceum]QRN93029.1 hypothetical protein JRI60_27900 [Archangium violaceum]